MKNQSLSIGQKISYTNGSNSVYAGIIVKIDVVNDNITVVDSDSGMILWNAGCAGGSSIKESQIV